jgi:hypothetical protein
VLKDPDKFYKHVYEPVRDIYLEQLEKSLKQYLKISIEKNNQGNAKINHVKNLGIHLQLKELLNI